MSLLPGAQLLARTGGLGRNEWLDIRRQGIGGSEAAAIAGLDPWLSPLRVYYDKLGELCDDDQDSEPMRWGRRLEDVIAREFAERTGMRVWRRNAVLRSVTHPWMLANLDRLVREDDGGVGPLEVKTATENGARAWRADEELPDRVFCQVQHYLAVTGCAFAWVAVLLAGTEFRMVRVERDEVAIAALRDAEDEFWQRVLQRRPPAADGSEATTRTLQALHARPSSPSMDLDEEARELLSAHAAARSLEAHYHTRRTEMENRLRQMLGDAEEGRLGERVVVTWRAFERARVDVKALREKEPELAERFTVVEESRRLLVKGLA